MQSSEKTTIMGSGGKLAVAFIATALAELGAEAEAREILSCYYPNSNCEGEEDEYGVSCTHTEANECPDPESSRALELDECVAVTGGGSRKVSCPGPVWPWLGSDLVRCSGAASLDMRSRRRGPRACGPRREVV